MATMRDAIQQQAVSMDGQTRAKTAVVEALFSLVQYNGDATTWQDAHRLLTGIISACEEADHALALKVVELKSRPRAPQES